jgi:predicted nucleotidyltransferase
MPRAPAKSPLPLFRSDAQARLLTRLFVTRADRPSTLTSLGKEIGVPLSTLQREVEALEQAGLVSSERVGNARLVRPNEESPFFTDLYSLLLKAFGPVAVLSSLLRDVQGVEKALIFGSWARRYHGEPGPAPRDLDLLVVGEISPHTVYGVAREAERDLQIDVNPVVVSEDEWDSPKGLVRRIKSGPVVELPVEDAA